MDRAAAAAAAAAGLQLLESHWLPAWEQLLVLLAQDTSWVAPQRQRQQKQQRQQQQQKPQDSQQPSSGGGLLLQEVAHTLQHLQKVWVGDKTVGPLFSYSASLAAACA
jgi:hypothetical protein